MGVKNARLPPFDIRACGDAGLTVEFGNVIDATLNAGVLALDQSLQERNVPGITEMVPTYRSLLVHYDPTVINFSSLSAIINQVAAVTKVNSQLLKRSTWRVPVIYGGDFGIDLEAIAQRTGQTPEQLIARHSAPCYQVFMIGFTAGFTYLGGLDPALAIPRRDEPRLLTPAGSITIGGQQTAIQSLAGPTGWHLLGRTPVRSYQADREPMFLFEPGDAICFQPVEPTCWKQLDQAAAAGEFVAERIAV